MIVLLVSNKITSMNQKKDNVPTTEISSTFKIYKNDHFNLYHQENK